MFKELINRVFRKQFSALRTMVHETGSLFLLPLPRTRFNYKGDVGEGIGSSVIMAPVQWMQRAMPEAPFVVRDKSASVDAVNPIVVDHPLSRLIARPNRFHSGTGLMMATTFSWAVDGNAYWIKVRDRFGRPVELWYVPHWLIRPQWPKGISTDIFISHYEYRLNGRVIDLPPEDVVHFRHGIDPINLRRGFSPLYSCLREVWSDDESSNFIASLLRNSGVPGVIVSPDNDATAMPADVDAIKEYFKEMFTGDHRGEPLVMGGKTKVDQFGFDPQQMNLTHIRNTAEERVCACLGIPPEVIGFGTGLEGTKVGATMKEKRQLAWNNGIIPVQRIWAQEIWRSLLTDFEEEPEDFQLEFDSSRVSALQEDETERWRRADMGVKGGWIRIDQAKRMVGISPDAGDDIYLRSVASVEVPAGNDRPLVIEAEPVTETTPSDEQRFVLDDDGNQVLDDDGNPIPVGGGDALPFIRAAQIDHTKQPVNGHDKQRGRATPRMVRAIRMLETLERKLIARFTRLLSIEFRKLGEEVASAADRIFSKAADGERKQFEFPNDDELERLIEDVPWSQVRERFVTRYGGHFGTVATSTFRGVNSVLGLGVDLADVAARRIVGSGGRRVGLIDIQGSSRSKLFRVLRQAREEGLGRDAILRLIREQIPAGPWRDATTRARVIARTETKFAQNASMVEYAREGGSSQVMMFDNRIGFDDAECIARDQLVVSIQQGEREMASEHPNGTLSLIPIFPEEDVA